MSQRQIFDYQKRNKGKLYSTEELARHFGIRQNTAAINCKRLARAGFIKKYYKNDMLRYIYEKEG